jgi:hypothetical protein
MKAGIVSRVLLPLACTAVLSVAAGGAARCEIGAVLDSTTIGGKPRIIEAGVIGDDPVPVGTIWHVYRQSSAGYLVLNPEGEANGDGAPSILTSPSDDLVLAAWARNSASGYDVVISRFANGAWTAPEVVVGDPLVNELDPTLVLAPDGTVHLFYWVDGATPQVYHMQAPHDLSSWSAPVAVSDPSQPSCRPAAAYVNGVLRVAYEVHDFGFNNSPREVVLARQEGSGFTPDIVAMTNNLDKLSPQVHTQDGKTWVDWVDAENGGSGEVAWTRLDGQGHWGPLHYEPFANPTELEFMVRGAVRLKALQP